MANVINTLIPLSGQVGDVIFYQRGGKTHLRRKPTFPKGHFRKEGYKRSLENAINFGGASRAAAHIHRQLNAHLRGLLDPGTHGTLAAAILKAAKAGRKTLQPRHPKRWQDRILPEYAGDIIAQTVSGLRLGQAPAHLTPRLTTLTRPDGTKVYRITGLPAIAQRMAQGKQRNAVRELRIRPVLVRAATLHLDGETFPYPQGPDILDQPAPSHWFDARLLSEENEHIDIPAPLLPDLPDPQQGDHIITLIVIEWRDRLGRRAPALLRSSTAVLHAETIALHPDDRQPQPKARPVRKARRRKLFRALRSPVHPRPTPQQRLKAALAPVQRE